MPDGFGQGRGAGRGGGMGFGFRGSSPPWPYVGRGRGGLPRCGYFTGGPGSVAPIAYQPPYYDQPPVAPLYTPFTPQMTREQELDYLKNQAEVIKEQLNQIDSRMRDLAGENKD